MPERPWKGYGENVRECVRRLQKSKEEKAEIEIMHDETQMCAIIDGIRSDIVNTVDIDMGFEFEFTDLPPEVLGMGIVLITIKNKGYR
jgi:hypothetical protein